MKKNEIIYNAQNSLNVRKLQYTVIDWVRGQQQFCLTQERIFCPKPQAEGTRSVQGSTKLQSVTALLYTFSFSEKIYSLSPLTYPLDVFNILVRQVRESGRRLDIVTSISRDLLNQ